MAKTETGPRFVPVKEGWAAVGDGWAIFAPSRSEATRRFHEADRKHVEIEARQDVDTELREQVAAPVSKAAG